MRVMRVDYVQINFGSTFISRVLEFISGVLELRNRVLEFIDRVLELINRVLVGRVGRSSTQAHKSSTRVGTSTKGTLKRAVSRAAREQKECERDSSHSLSQERDRERALTCLEEVHRRERVQVGDHVRHPAVGDRVEAHRRRQRGHDPAHLNANLERLLRILDVGLDNLNFFQTCTKFYPSFLEILTILARNFRKFCKIF